MNTIYVAMIGDRLTSSAPDLERAQADALTAQTDWASGDKYDYRWDEYLPGEVWRLMSRLKDKAGMGRRFSWTGRSVHAVGFVTGEGATR